VATLSVEQIDRSIAAWSANLAEEPSDFFSATNLATLYHGRGQLTGDLGDQERALSAARTAISSAASYGPARAIEAAILFTLHDFSSAFAAADSIYRDDPSQLGALATRADAALELGRIDEARRDLNRLATAASGPVVDIRLARLASVTGQADEALRLARAARDTAARTGAMDVSFYEFAVGEYARLAGNAETARTGFAAALAIRPADLGALLGIARVTAFDGDAESAMSHLEHAAAIAPQPETLALLGDLRAAIGDQAGSDEAFRTVRFIRQLGSVQGEVYDRQLIRFEADHGGATAALLEAARSSSSRQPDASGHDLVAWTLYRLGQFDAAAEEITAARGLGANDGRLQFHDGAIAFARGEDTRARSLLESALAHGPALDPIERVEAERLLGGS
jgi:tetratricopeptide (TPR) repeat protein